MQKLIHLLLIALASPMVSSAASVVVDGDQEKHFFSADGIPFEGFYSRKLGLVSPTLEEGQKAQSQTADDAKQILAEQWGFSSLPSPEYSGIDTDGAPITVRIVAWRMNEFGPTFVTSAHTKADDAQEVAAENIALFWTGDLDLQRLPALSTKLSALDQHILRTECQARGLEMRMHLGQGEADGRLGAYYMEALRQEERSDIADPLQSENVNVLAQSPSADAGISIVRCAYASESAGWDRQYLGPAIAYDLVEHRVVWRAAMAVDEHMRFIDFDGGLYLLHETFCDNCETYGWELQLIAYLRRPLPLEKPEDLPSRYQLLFDDGTGPRPAIGGTVTWFFED